MDRPQSLEKVAEEIVHQLSIEDTSDIAEEQIRRIVKIGIPAVIPSIDVLADGLSRGYICDEDLSGLPEEYKTRVVEKAKRTVYPIRTNYLDVLRALQKIIAQDH
jgi:hypothetical protein